MAVEEGVGTECV